MKARALLLVLAGLGCSSAQRPASGTATSQPAPRPVRVVALPNADDPLVTVRVVFESGSADDPPGREGLTRLTARLMAEGGTDSLDTAAFARALFPLAARVEFYVDRDMTAFTAQVHRDHAAAFYPLLRDLLLHPRLGEEDFARLRTQTRSTLTTELRGANDEELGKEALQALLYRGHPYAHPALGTEAGLDAMTVEDVRAHRLRVFTRGRVLAGIAGAYPAALESALRGDLAQLPASDSAPVALPTAAAPEGMRVLLIDKPAANATAISFGRPIGLTRRDDDHAALGLVTSYLGLHRQSVGVLYQTLREARGLNYGDYAYAEHYAQDGWSRFPRPNIQRRQQYASVWLRPVPNRVAHFALRGAVRALDRVAREGVPADDIARVRGFLGGYVGLYAQTASSRLGYALDDLWAGASGDWAGRSRSAWERVDTPLTQRLATTHLGARDQWVVIVTPDAQRLADALVADAASPITYDSPKPAEVLAEDQEIAAFPLRVRREDVRVVPVAEVFARRDWLAW